MNASGWSPRLQRDKGIDMSLIPVDTALQAGITDIFAVAGEINPHLFTQPLEDLGHSPELGGIHVVDAQHRVLMALLRAKRRGATVRAGTDHLQREVCIVTMHADENTRLNLVAPDRQVRMVRIDDLLRIDLRVLRPVIRHRRSEEHTSELQSPCNLVCRLLLEKKKKKT